MRNLSSKRLIYLLLYILLSSGCGESASNRGDEISVIVEIATNDSVGNELHTNLFKIEIFNNSNNDYFIPYSGLGGCTYFYDSLNNNISWEVEEELSNHIFDYYIDMPEDSLYDFQTWEFTTPNDSDYTSFNTEQKKLAIEFEVEKYLNEYSRICPNPDTSYLRYLIESKYFYSLFLPKGVRISTHSFLYPNVDKPISVQVKFRILNEKQKTMLLIPNANDNDSCVFELYEYPLKFLHDRYRKINSDLVSNKIKFK